MKKAILQIISLAFLVSTIPVIEVSAENTDKMLLDDLCITDYNTLSDAEANTVYKAPTITFEKGEGCVKLNWTSVDSAEKYGIVGWINNRWHLIDQCEDTSYVLNNLKAGNNYKVAVVTMIGNEWHKDFSNAITVTPLTSEVSKYPKVTNIKYSDKYPQFKLEWNAVDGATQYGIAVKLAGKWKVWTYTDKTNFISPKLKAGSTAEMVICAKVNGEWDTSNINSRAFVVTIDNATTTETLPVVFEITPSKTGVDEFLVNNPTIKSSYKDDELFNITPQEITEKFGFKIFKYSQNCETYLEYQGEVYQLGTGWGGPGTVSFAVADLNGDKHYELYFIYSWGSGLNHVVIDCFDTSSSFKFEGFDQYWSDDVVFAVENGKLGVYKAKYTSDIKAVPTEKIGEITADNEKNKVVFVPVNSSGTDSNKSAIAGKIFAYEKEGVGGYCTLSFNENGRFLFSPGKLSNYMGGGDWKLDGDTVSLIGMVNKTIYLKITDDALVYIAEGSDEFPYMDIKDGEKFSIYRPEISSDKIQLNSRYTNYCQDEPKIELDLIVGDLPEFCYVEKVELYDEDDNFIGMMSPAMDADLWSYLVDSNVTEEFSKTYYTLTKLRCGEKSYLDDVRSEITVNFK